MEIMQSRHTEFPESLVETIQRDAIHVLKLEADGVLQLVNRIDDAFVEMVKTLYRCSGRVIIGGIGKSGIVGRKIVATLNSTGTPALFIHPVEAMHGDLGIVCRDDVFVALSNSGETEELNILLPSIRNMGCPIIALTGSIQSTLAKESDIVIDVGVAQEACPMGLAPTASTTALLAMGDALAVVLINLKQFDSNDFRRYHPGGTLGQRLARKVRDIMLTGDLVPTVAEGTPMLAAIREIDRLSFGVIFILNSDQRLTGIITDGDIRRIIAKQQVLDGIIVDELMTRNPRCVGPETPAYDALNIMERFQITVLPITGGSGEVLGLLHLHDILGKGEFKFNGV
jgi:arabinose-5-phosphate isomerase